MIEKLKIRLFKKEDADKVSSLVIKTLKETNSKDYSNEYIEENISYMTSTNIIQKASWTHYYVVEVENEIVGCGAIGPYYDKLDESSLFMIFVLPEYQGKGIGRLIIDTLEKDEYFIRSKRIEIPSSITACDFYIKMGYSFKNGKKEIDDEQLYRLEKKRQL